MSLLKLTNLRLHLLVGFAAGIIFALLARNIFPVWIAQSPSTLALFGWLLWLFITFVWEAWQYYRGHSSTDYFSLKWRDTLADIVLGNLGFIVPWLVILLGTYQGNLLRPGNSGVSPERLADVPVGTLCLFLPLSLYVIQSFWKGKP